MRLGVGRRSWRDEPGVAIGWSGSAEDLAGVGGLGWRGWLGERGRSCSVMGASNFFVIFTVPGTGVRGVSKEICRNSLVLVLSFSFTLSVLRFLMQYGRVNLQARGYDTN
jgi:hypothetical protein